MACCVFALAALLMLLVSAHPLLSAALGALAAVGAL